jgi:hypothetical protein
MTNRSKVFVVQVRPGIDLTDAERFGDLVPMLAPNINMMNTTAVRRELRKHLEHMTDGDYILAIGAPLALMLAMLEATRSSMAKKINVLQWERDEGVYYSYSVNL